MRKPESSFPRILRHPGLSRLDWLACGVSTRHLPYDTGDRAGSIRRLQEALGIAPFPIFHTRQVHGIRLRLVTPERRDALLAKPPEQQNESFPGTDAMLVTVFGATAAIFTADCVPILIACERPRMAALVHAGWRGTLKRILPRVIRSMARKGCTPEDLLMWIGPAICGKCYEIGEDLARTFAQAFPEFSFPCENRLDLQDLNAFQAAECGVPDSRIMRTSMCTREHPELLFSYRGAPGERGRMITTLTIIE